MADAFSSYFLTHARGATLQWKRVALFGQMFYQLGDCGFTADGHHGTPNQRDAVRAVGLRRREQCTPAGPHPAVAQLLRAVRAQYPQLVAPDATS